MINVIYNESKQVDVANMFYYAILQTRKYKLRRAQIWVRWKLVLFFFFGLPAMVVHLYIDLTPFKIIIYTCASVYQNYYIWVVHHYALELQKELADLSTLIEKDGPPHVKIEATHSV